MVWYGLKRRGICPSFPAAIESLWVCRLTARSPAINIDDSKAVSTFAALASVLRYAEKLDPPTVTRQTPQHRVVHARHRAPPPLAVPKAVRHLHIRRSRREHL